jgi:hypothetical protein
MDMDTVLNCPIVLETPPPGVRHANSRLLRPIMSGA